ncbi:energy-coupling factor transport system ATP-binding protein [Desulfacinum hydrothermale DSM 13146]|uniref:Energy-coupling factor transport system ATP-binding protein n=1 Tax=Desulfacinum hydrothermale DSM 13146 TaxID=1121390 RepID=A0A1W1XJB9_9BACT|nr:energy-coupling factor transporter ATPase [Desulfacinum hydrothermale]SMC23907.1 energy-coupling factor transport system ATP-binding protein [Desulfacinum hydrothermale DSM 13146]
MHLQAIPCPIRTVSTPSVFRLEGVDYVYPNGRQALRHIDLSIHEGERIAVLGHNGSGKTTLARVLSGLAPPTQGRVLFQGDPLSRERLEDLRQRVGFLFQDPDDQLFCPTVLDDVLFGLLNFQVPPKEAEERARKALAAMGLEAEAHRAPHHLSYGQRKRAALAAILALEPDVLILDEPTANMDPTSEALLSKVLKDYPGTLICISHDILFLYGLCTRAVVLQAGGIHHDTSFERLISHRASLQEHGLDFTFRFQCCNGNGSHEHGRRHRAIPTSPELISEQGACGPDRRLVGALPKRGSKVHPGSAQGFFLEMLGFSYAYGDGTVALENVSFQVGRGERLALVGPNGAGKSTLAACLAGIRWGTGQYLLDGRKVEGAFRRNLWRHVGLVFQDSADQMVCSRCGDEVAFGLRNLGWPESRIRKKVQAMLHWAGLEGFEDRVPQHLSGGERKRLALAAVLAMEPEVLILDEPTAGLDPQTEQKLLQLLDEVEATLVLISHDVCFVSMLTDRTLLMHRGRIVDDLPTGKFLVDRNLHSLYGLDFTYYNRCCREIQDLQEDHRTNAVTETADLR